MGVWNAYMSVNHMPVWYSQRPEEGSDSLELELEMSHELLWELRSQHS